MTLLGVGIMGLVALLYVRALFSVPDHIHSRALVAVIAALVLIPTHGPPEGLALGLTMTSVLVLLTAQLRAPRAGSARGRAMALAPLLFLCYMAVSESIGATLGHVVSEWARLAMVILLCLSAAADEGDQRRSVLKTIAWLLPLELLLAIAQQRVSWANPWPRGNDAFDLIQNRVNELVPQLAGRSLGTLGHPILLGAFAVAALIACLFLYRATRHRRYLWLAALAPAAVALSGTRSAAAVMAFVIAAMFAFASGRARALRVMAAAMIVIVVLASTDSILRFFGFGNVEQTSSYIHRSEILGSLPRLLERSDVFVLFGSGGASGGELFGSGVMRGYPGYFFFDNQYVRIVAFAGVVGIVLLAAALVSGLRRTDPPAKLLILAMVMFMATFDVFTWNLTYVLFALSIVASLGGGERGDVDRTAKRSRAPHRGGVARVTSPDGVAARRGNRSLPGTRGR